MKDLLKKMLTDKSLRNRRTLTVLTAPLAVALFSPWGS